MGKMRIADPDRGPRAVAVRPNGEVLIYGIIGDWWDGLDAESVIKAIDGLGEVSELTVRINSPGGIVTEGMAIFNYLRGHGAKITVRIDALAASMASVIMLAGHRIVMPRNAMAMIHNPWNIAMGDSRELRKSADVLDKYRAQILAIYAARSGREITELSDMMDAETWMDADEAVALGFADQAIDPLEPAREDGLAQFDLSVFGNVPARLAGRTPAPGDGADHPERSEQVAAAIAGQPAASGATGGNKDKDRPAPPAAGAEPAAGEAAIRAEAVAAERARIEAIQRGGRASKVPADLVDRLIRDGATVADANAAFIDAWAATDQTPEPRPHSPAVVTADARDKFRAGAAQALLARAGMPGGARNEFSGLTLRELARESLEVGGRKARGMDVMQMVGQSFLPVWGAAGPGHTTSDFANILANVANKAMLKGFEEAGETFATWTAKGTLADFKAQSRVDLNLFDSLVEIPEGAEYKYGTIGDRGETIQLATYGRLFSITRQTVINDDMDAITKVPMRMGRAAVRTVGNLVYAQLTSPPTMSDNVALFHANHGNLAGSGAAPSTATLDAMRTAMAVQQDPDSKAAALNIRAKYVIVPVALEGTAKVVLASEFDTASGDKRLPNAVRDMAEVVSEARLDVNSSAEWFGAADPAMHDTIEVAYLDGVDRPYMETRDGWSVDGVEMKVRLDAGVKALGWRGLYKNPGASGS